MELDTNSGYTKCLGCGKRYHYQCSVSFATWKAKGQAMKDQWRCDTCKKLGAKVPPTTVSSDPPISEEVSGSGDVLKLVKESLNMFNKESEERSSTLFSEIEDCVKIHTSAINKSMDKLFQGLTKKMDTICKENNLLKAELNFVKEKLCAMELKMTENDSRINGTPPQSGLSITQGLTDNTPIDNTPMARNYSSVLATNVQSSVGISNSNVRAPELSQRSTSLSHHNAGVSVSASNTNTTTSQPRAGSGATNQRGREGQGGGNSNARPGVGNDGEGAWQTQQRRRGAGGNVPKIGTRQQTGAAPMVRPKTAPRPRTAALFVTRFAPEATSKYIEEIVRASLTPTHLKVSKIQTRHQDLYSSFHVEVLATDFDKVDDVNVWPDGCMIKPYHGRLLPQIVIENVLPPTDTSPSTLSTST